METARRVAGKAPPSLQPSGRSLLRIGVLIVVAAVTVVVMGFVWHLALTRFFTLDEYQWGHATWLVHEGKVPYRDFYEHHLPLGYVFHSLFYSDAADFVENALTFRKVAFAYIIIACAAVAVAEYVRQRDPIAALLFAALPICVGLGLLSAIDYRGDNWSAFLIIAGYAAIHINQRVKRRALAALAGATFSIALLMTQKTLLVAGLAISGMLIVSFWQSLASRPPAWISKQSALRIEHPGVFCIAAALPLLVLCGIGARLGVLDEAYEITVLQAMEHERLYPGFSAWRFLKPYVAYAPISSLALLLAGLGYISRGRDAFWALPTVSAVLGCSRIAAPYPYNFVLPSFLLGICAVGGYGMLVNWAMQRWPRLGSAAPLGSLVPLLFIPAQMGFVRGGSTNDQQLETLRRIEQYTSKSDVVIDSEGSALFRPDRGYYWYQGRAHVLMFASYYEGPFLDDLRATQAPFWLNGLRSKQLPNPVRAYLNAHYIPFRGDLYVLGFTLPVSPLAAGTEQIIDVVRGASYHVSCDEPALSRAANQRASNPPPLQTPVIDGVPVSGCCVRLDPGAHRVLMPPHAGSCKISYLPPSSFETSLNVHRHAPLFEYDRPRF